MKIAYLNVMQKKDKIFRKKLTTVYKSTINRINNGV